MKQVNHNPAKTFVLMKMSWRRYSSSSSEDVLKMTSRRLDQDQYFRLGHTSSRCLQDVLKTSSRRLAKTSSRRLQDVFKTSSRHVQDVLLRHLQEVFKTSSKHPQDLFKTFRKRLQDVFKMSCKDVFDSKQSECLCRRSRAKVL